MLHRPDLLGSENDTPILDDFYFYMAVGGYSFPTASVESKEEEEEE